MWSRLLSEADLEQEPRSGDAQSSKAPLALFPGCTHSSGKRENKSQPANKYTRSGVTEKVISVVKILNHPRPSIHYLNIDR